VAEAATETEARWWHTLPDGKVLCTLCPRYCKMAEGQPGFCFIRQNRGGRLVQLGYGRSTGFAVDPVEKKPLNHFFPGTPILSFGTAGCNLGCKFCQNWVHAARPSGSLPPEKDLRAQRFNSPSPALCRLLASSYARCGSD
jgi:AmmeMemoRadiSam system radical SAM enzyme